MTIAQYPSRKIIQFQNQPCWKSAMPRTDSVPATSTGHIAAMPSGSS